MDLNPYNESIRQMLSNEDFAQFLSENLSRNGFSQQEITHLLNLFRNQEDNNIHHSITGSLNSNNSYLDSALNHINKNNSNSSKNIENQNEANQGFLSDFSDAPVIKNYRASLLNSNNAAQNLNNNISSKEYENGLYQGELVNNKREGKGVMYYNCGDKYVGEYKNDQKDGKGIYISEGYKYEGDFKEGMREGKGTIITEEEHIIFMMALNMKENGKKISHMAMEYLNM